MQAGLALAGLALGAASSPHCAAMCGAPCAAVCSGRMQDAAGFHLGRLVGYMAAGALAAGSVGLLGQWSAQSGALRPLWLLLHLAFLALGLRWLLSGAPLLLAAGRGGPVTIGVEQLRSRGSVTARPWRSTAAGLAWVAWPCATLQAALMLAALADSSLGGAIVMAAFALASLPALGAAPWLWARWQRWQRRPGAQGMAVAAPGTLGLRVAGGALVLASGWAVGRGMWPQISAWCAAL